MCTCVSIQEYGLEQALDTMATEWSKIKLDLKEYKSTYIVRGVDEIIQMLDDNIAKTQLMTNSPYIEPFKDRVIKWEKKLQMVSQVFDSWLVTLYVYVWSFKKKKKKMDVLFTLQKTWMYLEPIFGSSDIMRQMPKEGKQFQCVDNAWKTIMVECIGTPDVLEFGSRESLLKTLVESNQLLDTIQKGLNDYLETKRLAFPRFYFLSNDALLEILSELLWDFQKRKVKTNQQTKNVQAVQAHLMKCFEGIMNVSFVEDDQIDGMISAEGETVKFLTKVNPNAGDRKGNVEMWLKDVELAMTASIRNTIKDAYEAYASTARKQWILQWPGQIVLVVGQIFWTMQVETALRTKGNRGLKEYIKVLSKKKKKRISIFEKNIYIYIYYVIQSIFFLSHDK
ncbi:dynein heavy chain 8 [Reticulomyxa filosa]|uniref:Dynein heavy chain 8 n=1 Tax=Reticulomyxa filosa TaxID=46433 RepID=X6NZ81_RETFI|nr:dynein heavy chain 8 [Reticulomyxa filosa]|eukprot:ETO31149.1 dynein heavy chain 8 [Reticulomyxa filosa]